MSNITALREKIADLAKTANHQLAEKGAQTWTAEEQKSFDNIADEIERAQNQIKSIERMRNLETFVRGFISRKTLGVGYASALEVARDPQGDCTEHAVLLAALGRALGIATRVVDGLARRSAEPERTQHGVDVLGPDAEDAPSAGEDRQLTGRDPTSQGLPADPRPLRRLGQGLVALLFHGDLLPQP